MRRRRLAAAAILLLAGSASASVVKITWDEGHGFHHSAELEAGGFAEVCGELQAGERVRWTFAAGAELDFNIHYHEGDEVTYPVKSPQVRSLADALTAPVDQTYCWMWANTLDDPVTLKVELFRGQ
jgi:hypothetical protein